MSKTKSKAKIDAWLKCVSSGNFKTAQVRVLNYIIDHPETTIHEIISTCKIKHQTVTSSLSLLMDEGGVEIVREVKIGKEKYSVLRFVSDATKRHKLKQQRKGEKYVDWIARGLREYHDYISPQLRKELAMVKFGNLKEELIIDFTKDNNEAEI